MGLSQPKMPIEQRQMRMNVMTLGFFTGQHVFYMCRVSLSLYIYTGFHAKNLRDILETLTMTTIAARALINTLIARTLREKLCCLLVVPQVQPEGHLRQLLIVQLQDIPWQRDRIATVNMIPTHEANWAKLNCTRKSQWLQISLLEAWPWILQRALLSVLFDYLWLLPLG